MVRCQYVGKRYCKKAAGDTIREAKKKKEEWMRMCSGERHGLGFTNNLTTLFECLFVFALPFALEIQNKIYAHVTYVTHNG